MNKDFIFVPCTPIFCRDAYYQMSHLLLFKEQFLKNRVSNLLA